MPLSLNKCKAVKENGGGGGLGCNLWLHTFLTPVLDQNKCSPSRTGRFNARERAASTCQVVDGPLRRSGRFVEGVSAVEGNRASFLRSSRAVSV